MRARSIYFSELISREVNPPIDCPFNIIRRYIIDYFYILEQSEGLDLCLSCGILRELSRKLDTALAPRPAAKLELASHYVLAERDSGIFQERVSVNLKPLDAPQGPPR